jgi:hypothetical protein
MSRIDRLRGKRKRVHAGNVCESSLGHRSSKQFCAFGYHLVVFIHPITGNDLVDHRDRAIWMGAVRPLDLSVLPERSEIHDL